MTSDVLTRTQLAAALTAFLATLTTPHLHLFKADIALGPDVPLSAFTSVEATGSWYTAAALTFGAVWDDISANMYAVAHSVQFDYSGTDPSIDIYGWFVVGSGTPNYLVSSGKLPAPVRMGALLDSVIVQPVIIMPPF